MKTIKNNVHKSFETAAHVKKKEKNQIIAIQMRTDYNIVYIYFISIILLKLPNLYFVELKYLHIL